MTDDELHGVSQYLYKLLDDISTVSDIAKDDDKLYRTMVEKITEDRNKVLKECDGYTVVLKPIDCESKKKCHH